MMLLASTSETESASTHVCATAEVEKGKYVVSIYDIMERFRLNSRQIMILAYGALSYSHFVKHLLLVTISQASLWEHWPDLADNPYKYNSVIAGQAFAWLLGSLYLLPLQDYYGRRNLFLFCNIAPLLLTFGSAFAKSFELYAIFRCLAVLTVTSAGSGANIYVIELVNPNLRNTATWLEMVVSSLGIMYLTLCKYLLEQANRPVWLWLQLFGLLPSLVGVFLGAYIFLECPGYQILYREQGVDKAWRTLEKVAGGPEEVDRILQEIPLRRAGEVVEASPRHSLKITTCHRDAPRSVRRESVQFAEAINKEGNVRESLWTFIDIRPVIYSWYELFKNQSTRSDTIALCLMWFGEAFCHWGIMSYCTLFYETIGYNANLMNIIAYIVQIPLHFLIMHLMLGHERLVLGVATITAAMITISLAILMTVRGQGISLGAGDHVLAVLAILVFVNGCIISGPLLAFTAQRYAIGVRASASGLMSGINSLSLVASSYLSSAVIRPDRLQYMLYANAILRTIVAVVIFKLISPAAQRRFLDFQR